MNSTSFGALPLKKKMVFTGQEPKINQQNGGNL